MPRDIVTLRGRIKQMGLCCVPWRQWRDELSYLPISAQTLFRCNGLPVDVAEINLKSEGWLFPNEILLNVLRDVENLSRCMIQEVGEEEDPAFGLVPGDWEEEDFNVNFDFYFNEKKEKRNE